MPLCIISYNTKEKKPDPTERELMTILAQAAEDQPPLVINCDNILMSNL